MSEIKKIRPITKAELTAKGVVALGDRPNTRTQYGVGGLSALELKKWFDALSVLISERVNELTEAIASVDAADYISSDKSTEGIDTLGDMVRAFYSGVFASDVMRCTLPGIIDTQTPVQTVMNHLAKRISDYKEDISKLEDECFCDVEFNETSGILYFKSQKGTVRSVVLPAFDFYGGETEDL